MKICKCGIAVQDCKYHRSEPELRPSAPPSDNDSSPVVPWILRIAEKISKPSNILHVHPDCKVLIDSCGYVIVTDHDPKRVARVLAYLNVS